MVNARVGTNKPMFCFSNELSMAHSNDASGFLKNNLCEIRVLVEAFRKSLGKL